MTDSPLTPTSTSTPTATATAIRKDGWTAARQRLFLEALSQEGSVAKACGEVGLSRRAAYDLRWRNAGAAFNLGWAAATLIARARLADDLLERALDGQRFVTVRDRSDHHVITTTLDRHDNRLGMSLLSRLDKRADADLGCGSDAALARLIAQDWEAFLDLIETGGGAAAAALFLDARKPLEEGDYPEAANDDEMFNGQCEVREKNLSGCSVWQDSRSDEWLTDFPPPPDFDGDEEGKFGGDGYERSLSDEEQAAQDKKTEAEIAPQREIAAAERDQFFGFIAIKPRPVPKVKAKAKPSLKPKPPAQHKPAVAAPEPVDQAPQIVQQCDDRTGPHGLMNPVDYQYALAAGHILTANEQAAARQATGFRRYQRDC
jgi:hypothetical protein